MYIVGLDISDVTFTASCCQADFTKIFFGKTFDQSQQGWVDLLSTIQDCALDDVRFCMEATGVYSERICHFLYDREFPIYVEPPRVIKKAFYDSEKTDPIDSRQISEYPFRFPDRLHPWNPPHEIIEQLKTLLTAREQLIKNRTGCKNTRRSLHKKHYQAACANRIYEELLDKLNMLLADIERDMHVLIETNPTLHQQINHIVSIPNIGFLLAVNLAVITGGFSHHVRYQSLARYIGICPLKYQSGTSIYRRPAADGAGPVRLRKLLYLASMRLRKNHPTFRKYFERKIAEGKSKKLVLNNIANRTLKLICGVLKSGKPYIDGYSSVKP